MISLRRYTENDASEWDAFVRKSRNGTFLFERAYMDYHRDRFSDHSLLFVDDKNRIVALLPANEKEGCLYSHQGLTYGGLVTGVSVTAVVMGQIFEALLAYAREQHLTKIYIKQTPEIYHLCPSEEEEYFLWRNGAELTQVLISTTIPLRGSLLPEVERRRRRGLVKAQELGYTLQSDAPLSDFWPIMEENLMSRYGVAPVHTLSEMQLLQSRFPQQIRCTIVRNTEGVAVAGAVVYEANLRTVHVQYGHANAEGKMNGALDLLYLSLIDHYRQHSSADFFDFGNSNEQGGHYLNENLIAQKEGFGGRGVVYKSWEWRVKNEE